MKNLLIYLIMIIGIVLGALGIASLMIMDGK